MKKFLLIAGVLSLGLYSCNDDADQVVNEMPTSVVVDMNDWHLSTGLDDANARLAQGKVHEKCHTMHVLDRQLQENPGLAQKMYKIEKNARAFVNAKKPAGAGGGKGNNGGGDTGGGTEPISDGLGIINIPVIVHVLYNTPQENISDTQIQSQIDVLNADFRAMNNTSTVPSEFSDDIADSEIQFTLSQVIRKATSQTSFGTRDAIKYSSQGGDDVISPEKYLNIWVGNIGGGILGYAQFPGGASATDGVVISPQYFGTTGYVAAPFNGGRTATHEVGHYLNLRHIWGDGRCNVDDFVADTPTSDAPNYGCPSYPTVNCRSTDMTMNYMDYTDDACMSMFTTGQKQRMRSIFANGGPRATML